jgi:hypothetical protein
MSILADATDITYGIATVGENSLTIYFNGSSANDSLINNWFTSNGWALDDTLGDGGASIITYMYSKAGFDQSSYTRQGNNCQIQVVKDYVIIDVGRRRRVCHYFRKTRTAVS